MAMSGNICAMPPRRMSASSAPKWIAALPASVSARISYSGSAGMQGLM
jgi:hypothetical protein